MENTRLITIEEHFTSKEVIEANSKYIPQSQQTFLDKKLQEFYEYREGLYAPFLEDTADKRIAYMDSQGIEMQILSYVMPVGDYVPRAEAVELCRMANNIMEEHIAQNPTRFRGMATLPMADPIAAAAELERCVKELGFVGTMLAGQWRGHWYDEPQFLPIFAKAAELDVPVYFHPYLINPMVRDYYYMSTSYSPIVGMMFSWGAFGWHIDTGIAVVRMILSGVFDKFPTLKIISGHWGEDIPMFLDRLSHLLPQEMTRLDKTIFEYYKENIYITPSGIMSKINLDAMVKYLGADRIIFSEDYPYRRSADYASFLWDSDLTDDEKYAIARGNAESVYHL